jgi:hypothetical protein
MNQFELIFNNEANMKYESTMLESIAFQCIFSFIATKFKTLMFGKMTEEEFKTNNHPRRS